MTWLIPRAAVRTARWWRPGGRGRCRSGQVMTFAVPVITVPVKVRRSGAVQADGWLPDQVRLGMLEAVLGDGVIEELCDQAVAAGLVTPGERRRLMSLPFIMRVVVAMTLLPDADYPEVIRVLAGLLPRLPWARRWQVPTHKTITAWRRGSGHGRWSSCSGGSPGRSPKTARPAR